MDSSISLEVFEQLHEELNYYKALAENSESTPYSDDQTLDKAVVAASNGAGVVAPVLKAKEEGLQASATIEHPLQEKHERDSVPREEVDKLKSLLFNTQKNVIDLADKCKALEAELQEERLNREKEDMSAGADGSPKRVSGSRLASNSPRSPELGRDEMRARKVAYFP